MALLEGGITKLTTAFSNNPVAIASGIAGAGVAVGVGTAAVVGAVKSRKSKRSKSRNVRSRSRRIKHTKRGWAQDRKRRSKQKWEIAYQKRKRKSHRKGVHYTKNGQPYIILSSGKARFIKGKRRAKR